MATLQTDHIRSYNEFKPHPQGSMGIRVSEMTFTGTGTSGSPLMADADVIEMCNVFKGETIMGATLVSSDLDNGTTMSVTVGLNTSGNAASILGATTTEVRSGGTVGTNPTSFSPIRLTANAKVTITVTAAPGNGDQLAGSVKLYLILG